jgi:hypothetical protein
MTWKAYLVGDRVSPYQLAILGVTNEYTEPELHLRVRGEWFKIDKELQRLIFNMNHHKVCNYDTWGVMSMGTEYDYQWAMTDGIICSLMIVWEYGIMWFDDHFDDTKLL